MAVVKRKVIYRLYPTNRQMSSLGLMLLLHQQLYNAALEHRIGAYKKRGKSINFVEQCSELTKLRAELSEYDALNAQSCQVTLKRLDLAFQAFFKRVKAKSKRAGFLVSNLLSDTLALVTRRMVMAGSFIAARMANMAVCE